MPTEAQAEDVHVWSVTTGHEDAAAHAVSLQSLAPDEQERAARFLFDRDRVVFVRAHALLRETLSRYADVSPKDWRFDRTALGKPILGGPHAELGLRFNLTHTQGLVACAVCRNADVGVDAEPLADRPDALDLALRFFSSAETASLQGCAEPDRSRRFIELWTLKEAFIKAVGEGLSHPLDTFSFDLRPPAALGFEPPPAQVASRWHFALCDPTPHHRLSVAVRSDQDVPVRLSLWVDGIATAPGRLYTGPAQP